MLISKEHSSTLVMALAIIAATMLISTVVAETLNYLIRLKPRKSRQRRPRSIAVAATFPTFSKVYIHGKTANSLSSIMPLILFLLSENIIYIAF
jgi:hypothetical protein